VTSLDLVAITGQLRAAHHRWAHLTHADLIQAHTLAQTCDLLTHLETTTPPTGMNGKN
jgi:hypothetical protein